MCPLAAQWIREGELAATPLCRGSSEIPEVPRSIAGDAARFFTAADRPARSRAQARRTRIREPVAVALAARTARALRFPARTPGVRAIACSKAHVRAACRGAPAACTPVRR